MMKLLNVSGSPHVHGSESVKRIMWDVNIALVPIFVVSLIFFGLDALFVSLVSVFCCILFQWLIEKFLLAHLLIPLSYKFINRRNLTPFVLEVLDAPKPRLCDMIIFPEPAAVL